MSSNEATTKPTTGKKWDDATNKAFLLAIITGHDIKPDHKSLAKQFTCTPSASSQQWSKLKAEGIAAGIANKDPNAEPAMPKPTPRKKNKAVDQSDDASLLPVNKRLLEDGATATESSSKKPKRTYNKKPKVAAAPATVKSEDDDESSNVGLRSTSPAGPSSDDNDTASNLKLAKAAVDQCNGFAANSAEKLGYGVKDEEDEA
ncbi:MAG: hypothetical protein Q9218_005952 [Villophora microphyllina]